MAVSDGMNYITLRQVIDDFIITMDGDDYVSHASDTAIRNIGLRGIREFGFDVTARIKSLKRTIGSNNTITLPDDYVDLTKIGIVDGDGIVYILGENKNINYSRILQTSTDTDLDDDGEDGFSSTNPLTDVFESGPLNIPANEVGDRIDSKSVTEGNDNGSSDYDVAIFDNYLYQGGLGRLYGLGGGQVSGEYRINLDQNRIEIDTSSDFTEVILEYVADEARSSNPIIHVYAEEALRMYMYYKLCERKSTVPMNEKQRARSEYYNERRKAKSRLSNFTKEEAMRVIRKNFKLSPKY
tara:strand:- start:1150 stop:2040 length:891 start_codon:yes stop_codon:yes gene_type:complete